ncbi:FidL-like protein [Enterobacter quasiroggenkampii]|uniref:FidL-like protein n=1 Tax=Enterobacter quasiroggenkampii TaxID=2497436 RepID=UPI002FFCF606
MKSEIKKQKILLPCLVLILIACNYIYFILNRGEFFNDSCVSVMRTEEQTSGFISTETVTLVLNPDKSGYIAFSGDINNHGKMMTLYRELRFKYEKESDDIYKMTNIETVKHSRDNAPDALVDSVLFSTQHEKARYMTLGKIKNSYVIGNLHSPVFICVVK